MGQLVVYLSGYVICISPSEVKFILEGPHVLGAFYSGSLLEGLLLTQPGSPTVFQAFHISCLICSSQLP